MRTHKMSGGEALRFIRPLRRRDQRALLRLGGFVLLIAVCAGALYYNNYRQQAIRERDWMSVIAMIEDARLQPAMRHDSQSGGATLYEVSILMKYSVDGSQQERWTTIHQHPQLLADAELQVFRVKKQQCIVRWNPVDADNVFAEIN